MTNYNDLEQWMLDRITAGAYEEIGSIDQYEDESGFCFFVNKIDNNTFVFTTELNPFAVAYGKLDATGNATIIYEGV